MLHPRRDAGQAVDQVLEWGASRGIEILGLAAEVDRLNCAAVAVPATDLGRRADLLVSLGGDGTMLRATRLADRHAPMPRTWCAWAGPPSISGPAANCG